MNCFTAAWTMCDPLFYSENFLKFKGPAPPSRLASVLMFLLELLRRNRDTDVSLLTLPLPSLLHCLMLVNEPQGTINRLLDLHHPNCKKSGLMQMCVVTDHHKQQTCFMKPHLIVLLFSEEDEHRCRAACGGAMCCRLYRGALWADDQCLTVTDCDL